MSEEALPEPDRIEGAPHPRETQVLIGQGTAEAEFLDAFNSGRLHHAWLLTGALGVGKATLAWKIARFLLATPEAEEAGLFGDAPPAPATLAIPDDHPVARRLVAGSEGRIFVLRRAWDEDKKKLKTVITVDEVRRLRNFLHLSAADGGRRVVIVDPADEMNPNAANALLKMLEEPPAGVVFLLVSHRPSGLLPTIRSRCRELRLTTLGPQDLAAAVAAAGGDQGDSGALAALAAGSVGEAIRLTNLDGIETYRALVGLFRGSTGPPHCGSPKPPPSAARRSGSSFCWRSSIFSSRGSPAPGRSASKARKRRPARLPFSPGSPPRPAPPGSGLNSNKALGRGRAMRGR